MRTQFDPNAVYIPPRLKKESENIRKFPLTVAEAPSGFGKTTVLEAFLAEKEFSSARVFKHTFFKGGTGEYFARLCEILSEVDKVSAEALSSLGAPCEENFSALCEVMGDLECEGDTYIFLDNLSGAEEGIELFLSLLSRTVSPALHFVVSVRTAGTESDFRFYGGRFYTLSASDFAFTKADIRAYFSLCGITLIEEEIEELYRLTDGWIFAICLQMLFYSKNKRFEKGIFGSLVEKAFYARLSEREKNFYVSLAPFYSFSLRKAREISGESADFVRAHLEGCGFVHYNEKNEEYYFHALLADFFRAVFDSLPEEERKSRLLTAASWEERYGEKIGAIRLFYRAGAYERIFRMPHTSYDLADIGDENTREMTLAILKNTPYEIKKRYPQSMVPLAFILFFLNETQALAETIGEIFSLLEQCPLSDAEKNSIRGETELLLSFTAYNDIAEMSRHHRAAYALLGGKASLINLKSTWTFGSPSVLCLYHAKAGELDEEMRRMDECMPIYYRLTDGHGSGAEYAMRAEADFLRGNFDAAETAAHRTLFEAKSKKQESLYQCGLYVLALLAVVRGDENALFDVLFSLSESAAENNEDMCRYTEDLFTSRVFALIGRPEKAAEWLSRGDINENRLGAMTIPFAHMIYGGILLSQKKYAKLAAFCPFAEKAASVFPTVLPKIYFALYAALAQRALGNENEAEKELEKALSLALPDRLYMPFAFLYDEIADRLPSDFKESAAGREIARLGSDFCKNKEKIGGGKPKLSPREKEVVELIRKGLTNKQIAGRLYVSFSTVKMTVANIFEKTGVRSRAQLSDIEIQ